MGKFPDFSRFFLINLSDLRLEVFEQLYEFFGGGGVEGGLAAV